MKKTTSIALATLFTFLSAGAVAAQTAPTLEGMSKKRTKADSCVLTTVRARFIEKYALADKSKPNHIEIKGNELQAIKGNCEKKTGEPVIYEKGDVGFSKKYMPGD